MDYHANVDAVRWFVREIWPAVAQKYPDLEFIIVGRNPTFEVRQLASHRIKVTGTVEDVRPYYASALGLVAPLRVGSGTRLKILEAMSAEVPVVSTRLGAEGIDVQNDVHLLLADSEAEFSAAIDTIATSVPTRSRLTGAARDLVVSRYDWSAAANELYRIHRDCLQTVA
jgi:glycosyltransferase involved in cell wall biosynthesis